MQAPRQMQVLQKMQIQNLITEGENQKRKTKRALRKKDVSTEEKKNAKGKKKYNRGKKKTHTQEFKRKKGMGEGKGKRKRFSQKRKGIVRGK